MVTIIYDVEYEYGYIVSMYTNVALRNIFSQVDGNVNCYVILKEILYYCTDEVEVNEHQTFVVSQTGGQK